MKRILQVIGQLGRGGDTTVVLDVVNQMDPDEYQVDFLTHDRADPEVVRRLRNEGHTVYQLKGDMRKLGPFRYSQTVYKILKHAEKPYDIIHVHTSMQSGTVLRPAKKAGIPVRICHSHTNAVQNGSSGLKKLAVPLLRSLYMKSATKFVSCSRMAGTFLFGNHSFEVIYNGIDTDRFKNVPVEKADEVREGLGVGKDEILIGHVAHFGAMKNHTFDISLAEELKDRPDVHFVLVGSGRNFAADREKAAPLGNKIIFTGQRDDVPALLKSFDMLILPSLPGEGFPVSVMEAQASGLPCLISEHVTNEVEAGLGLVRQIPLTEKDEWVRCIRGLERQNNYTRRERTADLLCEKGFGKKEFVSNWMKLYQ